MRIAHNNYFRSEIIMFYSNISYLFICTLSDKFTIRIIRNSIVGELGYDIHVENEHCLEIYNKLLSIGSLYGMREAGFRALHSLGCEKGIYLNIVFILKMLMGNCLYLLGTYQWGTDLRSDDTPVQANLEFVCRTNGTYKGQNVIEKQRKDGVNKRLVYLTVNENIPMWGLEGVYRNGEPIGHLRRAEFGYFMKKSIGKSYIYRNDGWAIDRHFMEQGVYEIDVLGQLYPAKIHLKSPFDETDQRIQGYYHDIGETIS